MRSALMSIAWQPEENQGNSISPFDIQILILLDVYFALDKNEINSYLREYNTRACVTKFINSSSKNPSCKLKIHFFIFHSILLSYISSSLFLYTLKISAQINSFSNHSKSLLINISSVIK